MQFLLSHPTVSLAMPIIILLEKMSETSVKISRDDAMPKTVDTRRYCKVGFRACNNLPQPPPYISIFGGLWKIVACSQPYLAIPSCVYVF